MFFRKLRRIRYRLIVVFLLLITIILVTVLSITYFSTIKEIKDQSVKLNNKLVQMGKNSLDSSIEETDKIFQSIYINKDFKRFISKIHSKEEIDSTDTYTNIKNIIFSYLSSRKDIFSIIYLDNRNVVYASRYEAGYKNVNQLDKMPIWFYNTLSKLENANSGRLVLPTHEHLPIGFRITDNNQKVFTIARNVINIESDYKTLGTIFVNLDLSKIEKIASDIKPYDMAFTYILSLDGTIVYDSTGINTAKMIETKLVKYFNKKEGNAQFKMAGKEYMAVFSTSSTTNWKIINFIPVEQYVSNVSAVTKNIILICLVSILFSIGITFLVSKRISNPIEKLSDAINKIDNFNIDIKADESGDDEIGVLGRSFNSLIFKLKNATHNEYESRIRQKDAELKALQAQINPHFLYNVLQSISSIAGLHNIEEINIMAKAMGKMLRYSINTNENIVSVEEELEHVKSYLAIQKIRFGEKFEYSIDIREYLKKCSILKLSLQPIVENAIIHGFDGKNEKGIIYIKGYQDMNYIVFEISDNGKGLTDEKLDRYNVDFESMDYTNYSKEPSSIGLKNVLIRLKLLYASDASLSLESETDIGTCVRIKFPKKFKEVSEID